MTRQGGMHSTHKSYICTQVVLIADCEAEHVTLEDTELCTI